MFGNIFASSFSASIIVVTGNTTINHNSYFTVVCDNGCTSLTLPSLTLSTTSTLVNNSRMFLVKNVATTTLTVNTSSGNTFEAPFGGGTTLSLLTGEWALLHGDNLSGVWYIFKP